MFSSPDVDSVALPRKILDKRHFTCYSLKSTAGLQRSPDTCTFRAKPANFRPQPLSEEESNWAETFTINSFYQKIYHILENWIIVPIRTRVLRTWIGWISTFGNFGVVLAKFVWGCEIPTTILTLNTNCSWSIMINRLKPKKRLLQVIYLNFVRYGQQLKSRSIYFLFSKRPTFADFGCDFESVRRLLDPHCSSAALILWRTEI